MGKKRNLELIANESSRRTTFRKRKAGLMKKASELGTLCGVMVCSIIYSDIETQPSISPSPSEVCRAIKKIQKLPRRKQGKYILNQDTFLLENVSKMRKKLQKERKKNRNLEIQQLVADFSQDRESIGMIHSASDLEGIHSFLDDKIKKITEKINLAKGSNAIRTTEEEEGSRME